MNAVYFNFNMQTNICCKLFTEIMFWCSIKKAAVKNFAIFTAKHLCQSLFLLNLQAFSSTTLLKRDPNTGVCFPVNIAKF